MQHSPDRVDSKPGTYEENCKHCKQEVAQYLTFGVIGHLGSLGRKTKHTMMKTAAWETSDNKTSSEAALQLDPKWITIIVCWTVVRWKSASALHHQAPTSISTSAASWRHMTSVPTRAMLFTYENVMREIVARWWRNMSRKSCGEAKVSRMRRNARRTKRCNEDESKTRYGILCLYLAAVTPPRWKQASV